MEKCPIGEKPYNFLHTWRRAQHHFGYMYIKKTIKTFKDAVGMLTESAHNLETVHACTKKPVLGFSPWSEKRYRAFLHWCQKVVELFSVGLFL